MADADPPRAGRFLTLDGVAEELATSRAQVYAMVRRKELPAVKIGGRGQWRVSREHLEEWIAQAYRDTADFIDQHPFDERDDQDDEA